MSVQQFSMEWWLKIYDYIVGFFDLYILPVQSISIMSPVIKKPNPFCMSIHELLKQMSIVQVSDLWMINNVIICSEQKLHSLELLTWFKNHIPCKMKKKTSKSDYFRSTKDRL